MAHRNATRRPCEQGCTARPDTASPAGVRSSSVHTCAMTPVTPPLVLASGSKARLRVLHDAGFDPEVDVSGVDEGVGDLTTGEAVVVIAERKASSVALRHENALVLGCDSMLELDGTSLGKPASEAAVIEVWRSLSGRQAQLFTGHCLIDTRSGHRVREVAQHPHQVWAPDRGGAQGLRRHRCGARTGGRLQHRGSRRALRGGHRRFAVQRPGLVASPLSLDARQVGVQITDLWR